MNQCIAHSGLRTVKQKLCFTEEEAVKFAKQLGVIEEWEKDEDVLSLAKDRDKRTTSVNTEDGDKTDNNPLLPTDSSDGALGLGAEKPYSELDHKKRHVCVVKPRRGVASDDVHLCPNLSSVKQAFRKIFGSIIFASTSEDGRNTHDSVLVQEFAVGTEYAVDFISKDGNHKMVALWKYDKRPKNGAPFVYHATELINATTSSRAKEIGEYVKNVLDRLGIRWGMTHNEVIVDDNGPRLVEVNCRQHNTDFAPLTSMAIGYNALDVLLAAYLGDMETQDDADDDTVTWDRVPEIPSTKVYCAIVHLVSHVEGIIEGIRQDLIEVIKELPSVAAMEVYPHFSIGANIRKTVDITTDAGWIHLINDDKRQFQDDYEVILHLMPELFLVNDE